MEHLLTVQDWVRSFSPELEILPQGRRVVQKRRFVTGKNSYQVIESFLLHRKMPRNLESLQWMQELESRLNMGEKRPVLATACVFTAQKAQLAKVLPGELGLYQVTLQAEYAVDLEDGYGKN